MILCDVKEINYHQYKVGRKWLIMQTGHYTNQVIGNSKFDDDRKRITMELDMDSSPRSVTFFVNDKEQNKYIVELPGSVRFFALLNKENSSFQVLKFE
ncbi:MAG: hypothetical protein EZS28_030513 [Streblomastix strix]|uniref:Uncharacterized protein n=1 Tax=Streblomastix strix TaxID=222440 RepID=A0A5J4UUU6_9EUKA|nr:MAG: hypothetical protein EZS28_030513 [Streblomastix strix]